MSSTFVDFSVSKLKEAYSQFGSYAYNEHGPDGVVRIDELVEQLKKVPKKKAVAELMALCNVPGLKLDPSKLVCSILLELHTDDKYDFLFYNEPLLKVTDFYAELAMAPAF